MKEKQIKMLILEYVKLAVAKWLVKSFLHTGGTNIINLSLGGQQKKGKNLNIWWPMPVFNSNMETCLKYRPCTVKDLCNINQERIELFY
jgi:hypothetical protein